MLCLHVHCLSLSMYLCIYRQRCDLYTVLNTYTILCVFPKSQKTSISIVISVRPSVRPHRKTRWPLKYFHDIYIYIYIVSRHSSREHRALKKFRHLTLLLAGTLTSFHVLPWCLISSKIVLRHVVRDLVP